MPSDRLVKVALPSGLVAAMDDYITRSAGYPGRTEFITDAIENLLADLRTDDDGGGAPQRELGNGTLDRPSSPTGKHGDPPSSGASPQPQPRAVKEISPQEALQIAVIRPAASNAPIDSSQLDRNPAIEPTWGMHNRDWPTLWVASLLGQMPGVDGVPYSQFVESATQSAWSIEAALRDEWDLSGFPKGSAKAARSEARFIEFFIGSPSRLGPLFDFGLATADTDNCLHLSEAGSILLRQLEGMTRERHKPVARAHRVAFLEHLSRFAPADVQMLQEIVQHIDAGDATRTELIGAIARSHPDWPEGTVSTNAAGYVARAREWGILAEKQVNHQYVAIADASDDLARVANSNSMGVLK